jgi:hypothetical protein
MEKTRIQGKTGEDKIEVEKGKSSYSHPNMARSRSKEGALCETNSMRVADL